MWKWLFETLQGKQPVEEKVCKQLIISSGDISDVDGFFALAEYAKTGNDVLYVMNYPAYLNVTETENDGEFESKNPGLGYKYSAHEVLAKDFAPTSYSKLMTDYKERGPKEENMKTNVNMTMKAAMTDMAYEMTVRVWKECDEPRGRLFFCIGGVNTVNPFSSTAVTNELAVFSECVDPLPSRDIWPSAELWKDEPWKDGDKNVYDDDNGFVSINWDQYDHIYVDFNGSMAFFSEEHFIHKALIKYASKIKGAFVMGGIYAEETPKTMPSIAGTLNRFSSATMNQLYHPENSGRFFSFMAKSAIPIYTVTNNVVHDLTSWADEAHAEKTYDGVQHFMDANNLRGRFLSKIARVYYENPHGHPPRKPFDYYVALALRSFCAGSRHQLEHTRKTLFYYNRLGVTLVSAKREFPAALDTLRHHIDTEPCKTDTPFVAAKKVSYAKELDVLSKLPTAPLAVPVRDLHFVLEGDGKLSVEPVAGTLIISTGDISDVDGFFALAQYAKTGADVLYVMNYPAYIGVGPAEVRDDAEYEKANPGLGYRYSAKEVLERPGAPWPQALSDFMQRYEGPAGEGGSDPSDQRENRIVKAAMTDLAYQLVRRVWEEATASHKRPGHLHFCVGGVNSVNPFSRTAVKNELAVFAGAADAQGPKLKTTEGVVYDQHANEVTMDIRDYDRVFMDFNGSMAFLGEGSWLFPQLRDVVAAERLRGVFVMGGVQAGEAPRTMPPIAGTLNRLSCATMNQLYHPENTARFFRLVGGAADNARVFTVTNNVVADLTTWADEGHKTKTYEGVHRFLVGHGLGGAFLGRLARCYYECPGSQPPRKAFDFYTALVLCSAVAGNEAAIPKARKKLFYCGTYGVALVGSAPCARAPWPLEKVFAACEAIGDPLGWIEARDAYLQRVEAISQPADGDSPFVAAKKASFRSEADRLRDLPPLASVRVLDVTHRINSMFRLSEPARHMVAGVNAVRFISRVQAHGRGVSTEESRFD